MKRRAISLVLVLIALSVGSVIGAQRLETFPLGGGAKLPVEDQSQEDVVAEAKRALQEDQQLPRYQGVLGPFLIGSGTADFPPCDQLGRPADAVARSSELYHPMLEGAFAPGVYSPVGIGGCLSPQVRVDYIGADVLNAEGRSVGYMFRRYFIGQPKVGAEAPLTRMRVENIGGYPALVIVPVQGALVDDAIVIAIERMPDGSRPGIMVGAQVMQDLELARSVVEQLIRNQEG